MIKATETRQEIQEDLRLLEMLEYIHYTLQRSLILQVDQDMVETATKFIEEIREPLLEEKLCPIK